MRGKDSVDFLSGFAFHLPVIIISDYLGVPMEAREQVRAWSEDLAAVVFVKGEDTHRLGRAETAMRGIEGLLQPLIDKRRKRPADDLISTLIALEHEGKRLSDEDIIANMLLLVFAGHETTMNLLANAIVAFNEFPSEWERLRKDPGLARTATEEALRYDGPIRALGRWAKAPFELGGKTINTRDRVLLIQHAANRDPKAFKKPDTFSIARQPNRHVAFGTGIHLCLGAPLARLETQEALIYLSSAFQRIELLEPTLRYCPTIVSRSLERLNVRLVED
jgi:cytochrome P450